MPVTALKIGDVRLKFMTIPTQYVQKEDEYKDFLKVEVYVCNDEFIPIGTPSVSIHEDPEEKFHTDLRAQSYSFDHFVYEESTNPEWNPQAKLVENGSESTI
jgi:hypothetical protein